MSLTSIPAALRGVFFHDDDGHWLRWDTQKVWQLPTPASLIAADTLWWHLELPVWPSDPPLRIFDLSPAQVLACPKAYPRQWERVNAANLEFPVELFESFGRWVIMDGYHRLARHRLLGTNKIAVRFHDRSCWPHILRT